MAEKSEILPSQNTLFKEKIIRFSGFSEYLIIGIDPVSFEPVIRICSSDGSYVTCESALYGGFTSHLKEKVDDGGWSCGGYRSNIRIESNTMEEKFHLQSVTTGEKVTISMKAAEHFAWNYGDVYTISRGYDLEYNGHKDIIKSHHLAAYRKHFVENFNDLKNCATLMNYIGIEK